MFLDLSNYNNHKRTPSEVKGVSVVKKGFSVRLGTTLVGVFKEKNEAALALLMAGSRDPQYLFHKNSSKDVVSYFDSLGWNKEKVIEEALLVFNKHNSLPGADAFSRGGPINFTRLLDKDKVLSFLQEAILEDRKEDKTYIHINITQKIKEAPFMALGLNPRAFVRD